MRSERSNSAHPTEGKQIKISYMNSKRSVTEASEHPVTFLNLNPNELLKRNGQIIQFIDEIAFKREEEEKERIAAKPKVMPVPATDYDE